MPLEIYPRVDTDDGPPEEIQADFESGERSIPHSGFHRVCVGLVANQSFPKDTWTKVEFDRELYDIGDMHDNTAKTRITITADGIYKFNYHVRHSTDYRQVTEARLVKNGSTVLDGTCSVNVGSKDTSDGILNNNSHEYDLTTGDYLEYEMIHDDNSTKIISHENTFFEAYRTY